MSGLNGEALRSCDACGLTVDLLVSKTISCETCQTDVVRCDECVKLHAPGTTYRCAFCVRVQHRVEDTLVEEMDYEPTDEDLDAIEDETASGDIPDDDELSATESAAERIEDVNEEGE